jgi:hypothetical protein
MSTKSKIQEKKLYYRTESFLRSCSTIDDTYCQIEKYVVTKEKIKTKYEL